MKHLFPIWCMALCFLFQACSEKEMADLIIYNGEIQTVDSVFTQVEAVAVSNGMIIKRGTSKEILSLKNDKTQLIDLEGAFMMPGFIEGHGHFSSLGKSLINLNLMQTKNWAEIVNLVAQQVETTPPGEWIVGRGWHQEKWDESPGENYFGYPTHQDLSAISPDNPVLLSHASGHGVFANSRAMEISGISIETLDPIGGVIIRNQAGEAIGVFEENAADLVSDVYKEYVKSLDPKEVQAKWQKGIDLATEDCLKKGITSFQDAGSKFYEIENYKQLAEQGKLGIRLWAMLRHSSEEMKGKIPNAKMKDVGPNFFTCNAIKSELDGALGSYGAWLLEPYADKADYVGQNTTTIEELETIAQMAVEHDMQLCVHAIGDRANREVLDMVERIGKDQLKDKRWRMEHAQHIDVEDIPRFAELGVIASMQAIHCTSDSPFVLARLGEERARTGAYPWISLLEADAVVTNGTDAPVEDVDPIKSYYASVTRKREDFGEAFFPEQAMTREDGLYAYTMANAFAAFEEKQKGSIEVGKFADFTVLSNNLLSCSDEAILQSKVLYTILDGKIVYQNIEADE